MRIGTIVASSVLFISLSVADEKVNCADPKGGYEESYCADLKYKAADKALNDAFKKVKVKLGKDQIKLLLAAQKGWLQLRDNQCSLEVFAARGATGYNGQYLGCLTELTTQRTKQLESIPTDSTLQ